MQIKVYVFKDIRFISDLCSITCLFLIALVAAGLKGHCPLVLIYRSEEAVIIDAPLFILFFVVAADARDRSWASVQSSKNSCVGDGNEAK